jgi:hypothetical protein
VLDPGVTGSAAKLAFLGVTAILTHRDALRYTDVAPETPNANWGPGYRLVARENDGSSVWQVVAQPASALVTLHGGFGDPLPPKGHDVYFPLVSPSGVAYFEIRARQAGLVRITFLANPPDGEKRVLRLADAGHELSFSLDGRTLVSTLVEVPSGLSMLLVKTDPAATSVEDAIILTAPVADRATGTPQLTADQVSQSIGF